MKYKIGYVDEQPTQVKKYKSDLRDFFDVIGYPITKGLTLKKLINLIYDSKIDLLMVDYLLATKGILTYNGDKVAREYEKIKPRFPILIFTQKHDDAFHAVDNPNIIYEKGAMGKDLKHFAEIVTKNIETYENYIQERKLKIDFLIIKGEKKGLNAQEKHQLIEAQQELNSLDKRLVEVPLQLLNENKIENLSKTTREAELFLKSLLKQSE